MNEFCFLIVYDILLFSFSVCSLDIILFIFAWNSMFKQLHTEIWGRSVLPCPSCWWNVRKALCVCINGDGRKELQLFVPHLKSGMPAEVLIPAPEWTTKYWDSFINWARISTFALSSSGLSNTCHRTENIRFKNIWPALVQSNITMFLKPKMYLNVKSIWDGWEGMLSYSILSTAKRMTGMMLANKEKIKMFTMLQWQTFQ